MNPAGQWGLCLNDDDCRALRDASTREYRVRPGHEPVGLTLDALSLRYPPERGQAPVLVEQDRLVEFDDEWSTVVVDLGDGSS